MSSKYWFARRFPVEDVGSNRMEPVSSEGWAVVTLFASCLVAGAIALFLFSLVYRALVVGVVAMFVFALAGAAAFIWFAYAKGDRLHTVDDYKAGRVRR